jgi:long-chain fatty acid transport protein
VINKSFFSIVFGLSCAFYVTIADATVGYFGLGYGAKSSSMAGATVASPQDAMAGAVNPAGISLVGKRIDLSLKAFNPIRDVSIDTRVVGGKSKIEDESDKTWFFIPGAGITLPITEDLWFGLTLYGNGGMNTDNSSNYYDESAAVLGAFAQGGGGATGAAAAASVPKGTGTGAADTGQVGVDLAQAILAPSLALKIHPKLTIGVSALLAAQRFQARGLGNFQCFTATGAANNPAACSPGGSGPATPGFKGSENLTDNGHNWAYGAGVRVGWISEIHPQVTLGGAFSSKIYMTKFSDYKELFAEGGGFDSPSQFQVGIAVRPIESLQLSFDYQRILYSGVNSVANKGPVASPFGPSIPNGSGLLGAGNGLGFGWNDINIYRLGAVYNLNEQLTFRAGYSWNESPIPNDQLLFNLMTPATIIRHVTAGITYSPDKNNEFHLTYVHAFHENQTQRTSAFGVPVSTSMYQNTIVVGYSWNY